MHALTDHSSTTVPNVVFAGLAHPRRRAILRILERGTGLRPMALAANVIAEEADKSLTDVTHSEAEAVLADIEHRHLPRLADAGLTKRENGLIITTDLPALQDPTIGAMIRTEADNWDAVLASLADRCRRVVLASLLMNGAPMGLAVLAAAVAERLGDEASLERVRIDLYHVHLPNLSQAGLVSGDDEAGTVVYEGHPSLDEEWLVAGVTDTP